MLGSGTEKRCTIRTTVGAARSEPPPFPLPPFPPLSPEAPFTPLSPPSAQPHPTCCCLFFSFSASSWACLLWILSSSLNSWSRTSTCDTNGCAGPSRKAAARFWRPARKNPLLFSCIENNVENKGLLDHWSCAREGMQSYRSVDGGGYVWRRYHRGGHSQPIAIRSLISRSTCSSGLSSTASSARHGFRRAVVHFSLKVRGPIRIDPNCVSLAEEGRVIRRERRPHTHREGDWQGWDERWGQVLPGGRSVIPVHEGRTRRNLVQGVEFEGRGIRVTLWTPTPPVTPFEGTLRWWRPTPTLWGGFRVSPSWRTRQDEGGGGRRPTPPTRRPLVVIVVNRSRGRSVAAGIRFWRRWATVAAAVETLEWSMMMLRMYRRWWVGVQFGTINRGFEGWWWWSKLSGSWVCPTTAANDAARRGSRHPLRPRRCCGQRGRVITCTAPTRRINIVVVTWRGTFAAWPRGRRGVEFRGPCSDPVDHGAAMTLGAEGVAGVQLGRRCMQIMDLRRKSA